MTDTDARQQIRRQWHSSFRGRSTRRLVMTEHFLSRRHESGTASCPSYRHLQLQPVFKRRMKTDLFTRSYTLSTNVDRTCLYLTRQTYANHYFLLSDLEVPRNSELYIYIYIYICVCVCVCVSGQWCSYKIKQKSKQKDEHKLPLCQ